LKLYLTLQYRYDINYIQYDETDKEVKNLVDDYFGKNIMSI